MKKRTIYIGGGCFCILIITWVIRFVYLNAVAEQPRVATYKMGEVVEYGDDFFSHSAESRKGYKIQVRNARISTYKKFAEENGIDLNKLFDLINQQGDSAFHSEYIYDLEVTVFNEGVDNPEKGIDLINTLLTTTSIRLPIDVYLWQFLYPQLGGSFSFGLKKDTQKDFHFPYAIENEYDARIADYDYLTSETFYLNISQYPVKKRIEIKAS